MGLRLLTISLTVTCSLFLAGCGKQGVSTTAAAPTTPTAVTPPVTPAPTVIPPPPVTAVETPPVLSVPIVDLSGTYDPAASRLGSLHCRFKFATDPNDRWCFRSFGSITTGRMSPSYDYKVAAGTVVRAAAAGVVTRIEAETNPLYPGEFEIEARTSADGAYFVIYDHIRSLTVALGSSLVPGRVLGTAGIHTSDAATWGRVELQIARITQRSPTIVTVSSCPRAFGDASFNTLHDAALAAHNTANPAFAAGSVCVAETVP